MRHFLFNDVEKPKAVAAPVLPSVQTAPFHHRWRFTFESDKPMTREQVQAWLKFMNRREGMRCTKFEPVAVQS